MKKLTIQCEIVTPLLMHGADKNAELREQSFKGIMRFWWRAIHGNLSLKELKEKEAMIFGNTEKKSSFRMKLINNNLNIDEFNPLPHKNSNFRIKGFSTNQTFEIEFFGRNLDLVKDIFILSTILGGFGQRSRRGFGSIKVLKIEDKENKQLDFDYPLTKTEIIEFIKKINPEFTTNDNNECFKSKRKFPYIKIIIIGNNFNFYDDYNIILRKIGLATHNYPCFGSANPRLASPVYVTICENKNQYLPVITSLNGRGCWNKFNDFKKEIL